MVRSVFSWLSVTACAVVIALPASSSIAQNALDRVIQGIFDLVKSVHRHKREHSELRANEADADDSSRSQAGPTKDQTYSVGGLRLGEVPVLDDAFHCRSDEQFQSLDLCISETTKTESRGSFRQQTTLLRSKSGELLYVNRVINPAFFGPSEIQNDILNLTRKFGSSPQILKRGAPSSANQVIAIWGTLKLETFTVGGSGILVDYLNDPSTSAKWHFPRYQTKSGRGFAYVAADDGNGRGRLRFFAIDATRLGQPTPDRVGDHSIDTASDRTEGVNPDTQGAMSRPTDSAPQHAIARANSRTNNGELAELRTGYASLLERASKLLAPVELSKATDHPNCSSDQTSSAFYTCRINAITAAISSQVQTSESNNQKSAMPPTTALTPLQAPGSTVDRDQYLGTWAVGAGILVLLGFWAVFRRRSLMAKTSLSDAGATGAQLLEEASNPKSREEAEAPPAQNSSGRVVDGLGQFQRAWQSALTNLHPSAKAPVQHRLGTDGSVLPDASAEGAEGDRYVVRDVANTVWTGFFGYTGVGLAFIAATRFVIGLFVDQIGPTVLYGLATLILASFGLLLLARMRANADGCVIDYRKNTLEFPGGGISANTNEHYFTAWYWLQSFRRFTIAYDEIRALNQGTTESFWVDKEGQVHQDFHHWIKFNGPFGAVNLSFADPNKRDELFSALAVDNRMGIPVVVQS